MNDKRQIHISKFISKHLRHEPEAIGLVLQPGGWVLIDDLLAAMTGAGVSVTREELEQVVAKCKKQRFATDDVNTHIRANQGHSREVDLQFEEAEPPALLYHGTAKHSLDSILCDGLCKMARHHVHLSLDIATARKVGSRHGKPAILAVEAAKMRGDGHVFFRSANGVCLVEQVPAEYLRLLAPETR